MGCSSQKDVQTNEERQKPEEENLRISLKNENNENNEEKIGEKDDENMNKSKEEKEDKNIDQNQEEKDDENMKQNQEEKLEENLEQKQEEIKIQVEPVTENKKDDDNFEEEIPEDIDIQEDEFHRILLGGAPPESSDLLNSRVNKSSSIKSYNRKSINKKRKKKPFIISVVEDSNFKKIQIIINASSFLEEYTMPIWCPKDSYIKFKVKGEWRIDKLYQYTTSKGLPSNNTGGFGYGALVGRIGNDNKFVIVDDKAVMVKEDGPLYLKQLLPKHMKIEPEGKLEVNVYDGEYMEVEEINKRIGWKENNSVNNDEINNENSEKKMSEKEREEIDKTNFEKKLRNNMNNLRMNPLQFYEQYIHKTKNMKKIKIYLEKLNALGLSALNQNEDYYNSILNYIKLIEQNNLKGNNCVEFISRMEGEIEYFIYDSFGKVVKVKCKLTQKTKPLDIIILCFLDKRFRFYIFNRRSKDLTVNILKNFYKDFSLIIMAFGFEESSE